MPEIYYEHPENAFNSPSQLVRTAPTNSKNSSQKCSNVRNSVPGAVHNLSQYIPAQIPITYNQICQQEPVILIPRRPEWSEEPSFPSIVFSENGRPGPSIHKIVKGAAYIDNANDAIFERHGWRKTGFFIDWPGVTLDNVQISTRDENGHPLTRAQFANILATHIATLIVNTQNGIPLRYGPQHIDVKTRPWSLHRIDYRDVRLMAVNYYRKVWIPVLGVSSTC